MCCVSQCVCAIHASLSLALHHSVCPIWQLVIINHFEYSIFIKKNSFWCNRSSSVKCSNHRRTGVPVCPCVCAFSVSVPYFQYFPLIFVDSSFPLRDFFIVIYQRWQWRWMYFEENEKKSSKAIASATDPKTPLKIRLRGNFFSMYFDVSSPTSNAICPHVK